MLVATDVAARGLDIVDLPAVFNFDVPFNAEDYVHRIGRTGRAGASGLAVTLVSRDDARLVADIEKLIKKKIELEPLELDDERAAPRLPRTFALAQRCRRRCAAACRAAGGRGAAGTARRAAHGRACSPHRVRGTARRPRPVLRQALRAERRNGRTGLGTQGRRPHAQPLAQHQAEEEGRRAVRREGAGRGRVLGRAGCVSRPAAQTPPAHRSAARAAATRQPATVSVRVKPPASVSPQLTDNARRRLQMGQQRGQQRRVAVRRLDHQLRLGRAARQRLQLANPRAAPVGLDRQIADEGKALAVEPAGRQRQQQRTGARQRDDPQPL